jgi:hypothetical protein
MTTATDPPLELLLSDAEDRTPVLDGGLQAAALVGATSPPEPRNVSSQKLGAHDGDPNLLEIQRWAVIAPEGAAGDRLLGAVDALIRHRKEEQGVEPLIFRAPPGLDLERSMEWRDRVILPESRLEIDQPRYLMLLGDLEQVSLELQHVLAHGGFAGRVALAREDDYAAYADKVIRWEKAGRELPRLLTYTVQDGTSATSAGYRHLVQPCVELAERWRSAGQLELAETTSVRYEEEGPDELLAAAASDGADVLLSLSHGLGAPRAGWRTPELQRRRQGALCLGLDSDPLTAETIAGRPFLPGGVWLMVACFGAGTPKTSVYQPWLASLAARGGDASAAREALRSLPLGDQPPFLAALPQAALANPNGPLAVIGHIDLAWTFAFTDDGRVSRASQVFNALRALLSGSRAGVGLDVLMSHYRDANHKLTTAYQDRQQARIRDEPDPVDEHKLARQWMRRNDLRGYVLLGDPAAHLPLTRARARVGDPPPPSIITLKAPPRASTGTLLPATLPPPEPGPQDSLIHSFSQPDPDPPTRDPHATSGLHRSQRAPDPPPPSTPAPRDAAPAPVPRDIPATPAPPAPVPRDIPQPPVSRDIPATHAPVPRDIPATRAPSPALAAPAPPAPVSRDITAYVPAPDPAPSAPPAHALPADAARRRERAVLALLRGNEPAIVVATRHDVDLDDLLDWLERYRLAGRRELARDD